MSVPSPGPLPEHGREDEHGERDGDGRDAEAPPRVIRDRLMEHVPRPEADVGAHGQKLPQPYRSRAPRSEAKRVPTPPRSVG